MHPMLWQYSYLRKLLPLWSISSLDGHATVQVCYSVVGKAFLEYFNEHPDNLFTLLSHHGAANGTQMASCCALTWILWWISHLSSTLLSWKAARGPGILPACYPQPIQLTSTDYTVAIVQSCGIMEQYLMGRSRWEVLHSIWRWCTTFLCPHPMSNSKTSSKLNW